jgi:hypothetical protein
VGPGRDSGPSTCHWARARGVCALGSQKRAAVSPSMITSNHLWSGRPWDQIVIVYDALGQRATPTDDKSSGEFSEVVATDDRRRTMTPTLVCNPARFRYSTAACSPHRPRLFLAFTRTSPPPTTLPDGGGCPRGQLPRCGRPALAVDGRSRLSLALALMRGGTAAPGRHRQADAATAGAGAAG